MNHGCTPHCVHEDDGAPPKKPSRTGAPPRIWLKGSGAGPVGAGAGAALGAGAGAAIL